MAPPFVTFNRRQRVVACALAFALALASPSQALGEPTQMDATMAQSLFEQGRVLLATERIAEACTKFAESQRLDPGGGTLLNLGLCHEREGRIATASAELESALSQAIRDNRKDREDIARAHMLVLRPRLPKLLINASRASSPELEVLLDGEPVLESAWGFPVSVDPGDHEVVARAPGRKPLNARVSVPESGTRRVTIPPLAIDPYARVASATAAPVTGSPGPAATWPVVNVFADNPDVVLQEQRKQPVVVVFHGIAPNLSVSGDDGIRWYDACRSPCSRKLDPSYVYRVAGDGVTPSPPFTITTDRPTVDLHVKAGSAGGMVAGSSMIGLGIVGLLAGTICAVLGYSMSNDSDAERSRNSQLQTAGIVSLGGGALLTGIGMGLALTSATEVKRE